MDLEGRILFDCDAPVMNSLGATSGEECAAASAASASKLRAHYTGNCNVVLLFRHTVGRAAPRRQHRRP